MLLMNLEQRPFVFGDIGRQVLATGTRKRPEYFMQAINGISKDDINRVAQRLLKSPPCLTACGEVTPNVQIQLNLENMIRDASCFRCRTKILITKITEFSNIITGLLKIVILERIVLMSKI
ncbi:mitochondrial-processing peptidase subunit alpha-like [Temnothorax curvispinosus]|uniref:Mitochondrial-processing peptidase subunit alpha-like n=1 Tax=Temnothorax curvispinosus TaxID=300111 RepID=A0A6J1PW93_9HYME|nr:mitochondrial-processing peptidase subunit alpha-like [Temnothorax curvispinosus]